MFCVRLRKGDERLSDVTDNESRRAAGNREKKRASKPKGADGTSAGSKSPSDVGRALRSVYDTTLGERVPDDFLDLLGKLS
ncbi:MAG: hypothetical protein LH610_03540 [Sphingomonas bacterium]|nr:hypothetical protein [Sphingomonas bacterium]